MEDTTPSYERLYLDHLRVLSENYLKSEDFHKQIQVLKDERDSYKAALASISLFVSTGMGEEDTTAEDYAKRIKDGIAQMVLDMSTIDMTITELINETQEELVLTQQIIQGLVRAMQDYPKGHHNPSKLARLEHIHSTLQALNGVLTEPVY
jgi:hypothetical protein